MKESTMKEPIFRSILKEDLSYEISEGITLKMQTKEFMDKLFEILPDVSPWEIESYIVGEIRTMCAKRILNKRRQLGGMGEIG